MDVVEEAELAVGVLDRLDVVDHHAEGDAAEPVTDRPTFDVKACVEEESENDALGALEDGLPWPWLGR